MRPSEQGQWKQEVVEHIFSAVARRPSLSNYLVFKGGQVLSLRLPHARRASLDLDATEHHAFRDEVGDREQRDAFLKSEFSRALREYFEAQEVVRFELLGVTVKRKPRGTHPRGWDASEVRIRIRDALHPSVAALPTLTVDVSAPESLLPTSVQPLQLRGDTVAAYSLIRIAAEKLRAFLQSLPPHRAKTDRRDGDVRVKDIYDVASIVQFRPLDDAKFWKDVAVEFVEACRSRAVDCIGMRSFEEGLTTTRSRYERDPTIPNDIPFEAAWAALEGIVTIFHDHAAVPFEHPDD